MGHGLTKFRMSKNHSFNKWIFNSSRHFSTAHLLIVIEQEWFSHTGAHTIKTKVMAFSKSLKFNNTEIPTTLGDRRK